ncbi:chemotaxis protein CheB [Siccirubricoccus phaeus]|uniref:chemotaxis protein CheB n=1 Tax=Siccirubricoccus phaeus TaxID=2595053 RepID=UPI0011F16EFC|nr:chemotaxis protein CheB [Siccirubricoccus phaeus]
MRRAEKRFPVVGIGASAGGVEALQALFRAMPEPPLAMAFVVVTHLGPDHESALPAILRDCTSMPVVPARDAEAVEPGHAYILPNDAVITMAAGRLVLRRQPPEARRERQPIDVFLASLAEDQGEWAVGIVLSGSGSDGTLGLKAIKEWGGLTLAQGTDGTTPRYPEMPASAVAGGAVDLVLPVEEMPVRLAELTGGLGTPGDAIAADAHAEEAGRAAAAQEAICGVLRARIGHDFSGYKDKTFFRRVQRRMQVLRLPDLDAYLARLRQDPEEAATLFRDLLIGVTGFFRDADAFAALAERVIPALFEGRGADDTVRVWVPGCATGEEAYSLAILLRERMDAQPGGPQAQIFATDIDEAALAVARRGRYPACMMSGVAPERLARFFAGDGAAYAASKELRDLCVFSTHSVIRDAPFSRIDLVSCRNLLIYLGGQLQEQVIPLFHYALRPGGFLFLGVSETITRHADLFTPEDKAHRIFRRRQHAPIAGVPLQIQPAAQGAMRPWRAAPPPRRAYAGGGTGLRQAVESFVLEQFTPPHVVVNRDGDIVHQSARLGKYLEPTTGAPSRQLLSMARRGLRLELRAALREAVETRRQAVRPRVEVEVEDRRQAIALTVAPLPVRDDADPLFVVLFADLGPPLPRTDAPMPAGAELQGDGAVVQLERELRDTRERLQSTVEEYETATEELKSANEEMVSVNEELQSANEELETSKEELQSVNEELRTANFALSGKVDELDRANADLRNLFDSTQIATVFLDQHLVIRSFTPAVTAIFNLVATDRGRPLTDFASHLDRVDLRRETRRVLDEREPVERRVTARDGAAHYLMRMLPYRTAKGAVDGVVVTFFDVTQVVEGEVLGTLVDELNHRVRNMLQVVQAVATSTLRRASSLEEFGRTFGGRIRALGRAHELVSQGGWSDVPLRDLVLKELRPYAEGLDRVAAQGPPVRLKPKAALALGMVLHELATNATKHGALSAEHGRVRVAWSVAGEGAAARLVLRWCEEDGPRVQQISGRRGFGSELIERQLRHDLGGAIEVEFAEAGLRATLTLPLSVTSGPGRGGLDDVVARGGPPPSS